MSLLWYRAVIVIWFNMELTILKQVPSSSPEIWTGARPIFLIIGQKVGKYEGRGHLKLEKIVCATPSLPV